MEQMEWKTGIGVQAPEEITEIELSRKQMTKCEVIAFFIGTGLLGFWFGIGAALGAKIVNSLEGK